MTATPEEALRKAIDALGGITMAARTLNVKDGRYQTVQSWLSNRVPAEHCPAIERATDGAVRCEDLRPDIDWAVLRDQAAPLIPAEEARDAA